MAPEVSEIAGATPPALDREFDGLRRRLRSAFRSDGFAVLAGSAATWALVSYGLDRLIELPWAARAVGLVLLALLLARSWMAMRSRLRRRLGEDELARAVERRYPQLEGQLLNALELRRDLIELKAAGAAPLERALIWRALSEADAAARSYPFSNALDYRPVMVRAALSTAAVAAFVFAGALSPDPLWLWSKRNLLLSNEAWPRLTRIELDREESVWHTPRGESLALWGWARGSIPPEATIHITADSGKRRVTIAPGPNGRFSHVFPEVVEPFEFDVRGGDGRTEPRRVEVHDRPRILGLSIALVFPAYLGREPERLDNVAGEVTIPAGTTVAVRARADLPLKGGWVAWQKDARVELQPIGASTEAASTEAGGAAAGAGAGAAAGAGGSEIEHRFEPKASGSLDVAVTDAQWGLESRPPARVRFLVKPDAAPQVVLTLLQKTRLVTPAAEVPYRVEAKDDHGFSRLGLETAITGAGEEDRKEMRAFEGIPAREPKIARDETLALEPLGLEEGMKVTLTAEGADNDGLAGPKVARSASEVLQVVSPEEFQQEMARLRAAARRELEEVLAREEKIAHEFAGIVPTLPEPGQRRPAEEESADNASESPFERSKGSPSSEKATAKQSGASKSAAKSAKSAASEDSQTAEASQASQDSEGSETSPTSQGAQASKSSSQAKKASSKGVKSSQASKASKASPNSQDSPEGSKESPPEESQARSGNPEAANEAARLAREQAEAGQRMNRAAQDLRDAAQGLDRNRLRSETERQRFDAEVTAPLDELAQDRLPRAASELKDLARKENPRQEAPRVQAELERNAEMLRDILDRLSDTEDFSDVLQRLEGVLDLQRKAISATRDRAGSASPAEKVPEKSPPATEKEPAKESGKAPEKSSEKPPAKPPTEGETPPAEKKPEKEPEKKPEKKEPPRQPRKEEL